MVMHRTRFSGWVLPFLLKAPCPWLRHQSQKATSFRQLKATPVLRQSSWLDRVIRYLLFALMSQMLVNDLLATNTIRLERKLLQNMGSENPLRTEHMNNSVLALRPPREFCWLCLCVFISWYCDRPAQLQRP